MFSTGNYIVLFVLLIGLAFLYRKLEEKRIREEDLENYGIIKKYLLNDTNTLGKSKKPILWMHIPYEYNARDWLSFGSRSSHELNQPYLYLTVKSVIDQCQESFHICMIDDEAFSFLIPEWNIQMNKISHPVSDKIRMLGLANIVYQYGGMVLPISFLCLRDLSLLYEEGVKGERMFVGETEDRFASSVVQAFHPNLGLFGAQKKNETVLGLVRHMETVISRDYTEESRFLGDFSHWCQDRIVSGDVHLVDGRLLGTKGTNNLPIDARQLLSDYEIKLDPTTYGIWIPAMELLRRRSFEWFTRLSTQQVLDSNTVLGSYFRQADQGLSGPVVEPMEERPHWVRFWKTPLARVYGLKPNFLGDNLLSNNYPNY